MNNKHNSGAAANIQRKKCSSTEGRQHQPAVWGTWKGWEREREPVVVKGVSSIAGGSASFSAIAPVIAPSTYKVP